MIIAIWGRSGTGKSVIANELGRQYAQRGKVTLVVDTDMTQPTLPPRLPNTLENNRLSLGAIFSSPQVKDAQIYLHSYPRVKGLFFAGLLKDDNYLSYQIGMRQFTQAVSFIRACQDIIDVIILDCSGQRGDPFLAVALEHADHFFMIHTPDTKNACWYLGVKPIFTRKSPNTILHVGNAVQKHHSASEYEKITGIKFSELLPTSRTINEVDGQGSFASCSSDHQSKVWLRNLNRLVKGLESDNHER